MDDTDIGRLRANLHGELIQPGEDRYKEALGVWNGMTDKHAAPVVRGAEGCDAVRAVNSARDNSLSTAVRADAGLSRGAFDKAAPRYKTWRRRARQDSRSAAGTLAPPPRLGIVSARTGTSGRSNHRRKGGTT